MSKTTKDLKSHKKGYGKYGCKKPKRKMKPLSLEADLIDGSRHHLVFIDQDIKQDEFAYDTKSPSKNKHHWLNAKMVKSKRKNTREERDYEKKSARSRMKQILKEQIILNL